jgi:GNAT superfamily N-acetyltransferase
MRQMEIRRTREADWQSVRALRLEMLQDTPTAFSESIDNALAMDEAAWRARARRDDRAGSTSVVAITNDGTWAGTMSAYIPDADTGPVLAAVYVRPAFRGRANGVADQLLDVVEAWATDHGDTLRLLVHADNRRGRSFYERRGYAVTGRTEPYHLDPRRQELEMIRHLHGGAFASPS